MRHCLLRSLARLGPHAAALLWLTACLHPWDDYEAPEGSPGGGGSSNSLCARLCTAYDDCFGSEPTCPTECALQLPACQGTDLDNLDGCVVILESCAAGTLTQHQAVTALEACVATVSCYSL